jgi:DNA repair ATPase RecN
MELEHLRARVDAIDKLREGLDNRFALLSEKIGEIRSMVAAQDKSTAEIKVRAEKAADLIEKTRPEGVLAEVKRRDMEIDTAKAKLEALDQLLRKHIEEIRGVRKTVGEFRGIDELIKLSRNVKSDLAAVDKIKTMVEKEADKVGRFFIQSQAKSGELHGMSARVESFDSMLKKFAKDLNTLEARSRDLVTRDELQKHVKERLEKKG